MGHWYDKQANPRHFEAPGNRPTTLREARKLAQSGDPIWPSVTTVLGIRDAPQLTYWLQKQAVLKAAQMPCADPNEAWAAEVIASAKADTMALADDGTDIHKMLECYWKGESIDPEYQDLCYQVFALLDEKCGQQEWKAETYLVSDLGYAGLCDLHSPEWVVDFKTKDGDVSNVRGYPNQAEQLAAYAHGLKYPNARTANLFISRDRALWGQPEAVSFYEHTDDNAWNRFYHTLLLWQVEKKYGPLWDKLIKEHETND